MVDLPSERLAAIGLELPPSAPPVGSYAPCVIERDLAWVSGQGAWRDGSVLHPGLVDRDVPLNAAKEAARFAALQALRVIATAAGSIDSIHRVVRVGVFVASSPGFTRQHEVANGATELLLDLFGEAGRPARAAVGVASLPLNFPVELEMLAALR